jgi:hypothetical protein
MLMSIAVPAALPIPLIVGCDAQINDEQLSKIQAVLIRKINALIRSEVEAFLSELDEIEQPVSRYPVSRPVTPFFMPCVSLSNLHETFFDVLKEECALLKKAHATRGRSLKPVLHAGVLQIKNAYVQITLRGQRDEARSVINRFETACAATNVLQQAVLQQAIGGLQEDIFDPVIRLVVLPQEELLARSPVLWQRVQERIADIIIPKIIVPEIRLEVMQLTLYEQKQHDRFVKRYVVSIE